jgi:hypothetical protein
MNEVDLVRAELEDLQRESHYFLQNDLPRSWQRVLDCIVVSLRCLGGSSFTLKDVPQQPSDPKQQLSQSTNQTPQKLIESENNGGEDEEKEDEKLSTPYIDPETTLRILCDEVMNQSLKPSSFLNEPQGLKGFVLLDGWKIVKGEVNFQSPKHTKSQPYSGRIDRPNQPWVLAEVQGAFNEMMRIYKFAQQCNHFFTRGTDIHTVQQALLRVIQMVCAVHTTLLAESPNLFVQRRKLPLSTSSGHPGLWRPPLSNELIIEFGTDERLSLVVYVIQLTHSPNRPPQSRPGEIVGHSFFFRGLWFQVKDVAKCKCELPTLQLAVSVIVELQHRLTRLHDHLLSLRPDS